MAKRHGKYICPCCGWRGARRKAGAFNLAWPKCKYESPARLLAMLGRERYSSLDFADDWDEVQMRKFLPAVLAEAVELGLVTMTETEAHDGDA